MPCLHYFASLRSSPDGKRHSLRVVEDGHIVALGELSRRDQDPGAERYGSFHRGADVFHGGKQLHEVWRLRRGRPNAALYAGRRTGIDPAVAHGIVGVHLPAEQRRIKLRRLLRNSAVPGTLSNATFRKNGIQQLGRDLPHIRTFRSGPRGGCYNEISITCLTNPYRNWRRVPLRGSLPQSRPRR